MGTLNTKHFAGRQGDCAGQLACRASFARKPPAPARGRRVPLSRAHFSTANWQQERSKRLSRICRALDRGLAAGKPLRKLLAIRARWWKGRTYSSDSARPIQFSRVTLGRVYRVWRASGGDPAALALKYKAPVKLHPSQALAFGRLCIHSDARSFAEAYGRLPRPRATVYAYRLRLGGKLLRRILNLFSARRLVDVRQRKARAAVNKLTTEGARCA